MKRLEVNGRGNHGAIWLSAIVWVRTWAFGVHVDVWTTGYDVMLCLGPWQPRWIWIPGTEYPIYRPRWRWSARDDLE